MKYAPLMAGLVGIAFMAAGCGGQGAAEDSAGSQAPEAAASSSAAPGGPASSSSTAAGAESSTSEGSADGSAGDQAGDQASGTPGAEGSQSADGTAAKPADPVTPKCLNADLKAGYHATDAGAGSRFGEITLTNVSDHACALGGFGGLSYVGGGDGTQVGEPAVREGSWRKVIMKPGQVARSEIAESTADKYPAKTCRPTEVDGFRIYVPDSRESQFVRHATTGCANDDVQLLSHHAFH